MKLRPFNILLQYLLPHKWLSHIVGNLSRCQIKWLKQLLIKCFCAHYRVNLTEAAYAQPEAYKSFHDFFTRHLQPNARTFDYGANHLLSPVDGTLSQLNLIKQGSLLQAKEHDYTLHALLGHSQQATLFEKGYGLTFYLAPRDYHRVHMPIDGQLLQTQYIPGQLFSVNPQTAEHIPGLFTRNERLVCLFETDHGSMAVILVGAMIVGNIHTTWDGLINPGCQTKDLATVDHRSQNIRLKQGDELGYFAMGSTVITLLSQSSSTSLQNLPNNIPSQVCVGSCLGYYTTNAQPTT